MPVHQVTPTNKINTGKVTDLKLVTIQGHVNGEPPHEIVPDGLSIERQRRSELAASMANRRISTKATSARLWRIAIVLGVLLLFVAWLRS